MFVTVVRRLRSPLFSWSLFIFHYHPDPPLRASLFVISLHTLFTQLFCMSSVPLLLPHPSPAFLSPVLKSCFSSHAAHSLRSYLSLLLVNHTAETEPGVILTNEVVRARQTYAESPSGPSRSRGGPPPPSLSRGPMQSGLGQFSPGSRLLTSSDC